MSLFFATLFYFAFLVFVLGLAGKIADFARTPSPLSIPTTPAPATRSGVAFRMTREIVLFESLFKGDRGLWLCSWIFHLGLFIETLRHVRYFLDPMPVAPVFIESFARYAAFLMLAGLLALWARRLVLPRVRYLSRPSDHLMLALIVGIVLTGMGMSFLAPVDILAVNRFFLGLRVFEIHPLPDHPWLFVHLFLVAVLLIVFPFSKLLHAPGLFFSPTRNQADTSRQKRRRAAWAAKMEARPDD